MRVLHLTTSFPADENDVAGTFVYKLINALNRNGSSCHILTPATTFFTSWPDAETICRFRYAPWKMQILAQLPGGIPAALKRNLLNFALLPTFLLSMAVTLCVRARQCDIIHAHWSICGAIAVITRPFHRKPVIITVHGSDHHTSCTNRGYALLHHLAIRGASFTVCVSKALLANLQKNEPAHAEKFKFIGNGVSDVFFEIEAHRPTQSEPLRLLTIGSLIPLKGVDVIIQSLAQISSSEWKLTVLGDGVELKNLQKLAATHSISDHIHFMGNVAPESIAEYMAQHQILILSSYREGRPSVILEAMAAAMAVIATDIDGTNELVQHEKTGWLFPSGDMVALARIVDSLASKEKEILDKGLAGRKWMQEQKMTWDDTAVHYQRLYRIATTQSKKQRPR